jgi:heme-degrading monooxygenase HmoA
VSGRANAVYRVTIEVAPVIEESWARWHAADHMPDVLRQPGFLGATRWKEQERAADGWIRYVVHYRADSVKAIEAYRSSAEAVRVRDDHTNRYGNVTRLTRTVLAEPIFVGPER